MTRRCEVGKIGIDLPCYRQAKHFMKIVSKRIGDHRKFKIWLCDKHYHELMFSDGTSVETSSVNYEGHLGR